MVFDTARNYTVLPRAFGFLKDVIIYFWAILLLFKGKFEYPRLGYSFYFLVILFMIWSWIGVFYPYKSILETVIFIVKNAEWIVLFFVFYNYRSFFSISYEKAIKLYIYFSVALFFITLVGLFIPNPIIGKDIISENNENFPDYANRFSLGQPAVASFSQLVSAIYLLTRRTKSIVQVICMLVCMSGVLLSTSTTGILVLVCILILYGGYGVMLAPSRTKIKITVGLISLVAIIYYIVNSTWFIENFGLGYLLLSTKIDAFFGGNSYDPSMAVRDAQQENVLRILGMTPFGYLLGQGVSGLFV